jgi:hypothetical protein
MTSSTTGRKSGTLWTSCLVWSWSWTPGNICAATTVCPERTMYADNILIILWFYFNMIQYFINIMVLFEYDTIFY